MASHGMNPGAKRRKVRSLKSSDGTKCHWCHRELDDPLRGEDGILTLDHIVPYSKSRNNHLTNLVLACYWCNNKRGAKRPEVFLAWMQKEHPEVFTYRLLALGC